MVEYTNVSNMKYVYMLPTHANKFKEAYISCFG